MSKEEFQKIHTLITAQRFDEARSLLEKMDHPQAQNWLKQLNKKQVSSKPSPLLSSNVLLFGITTFVIIFGLILALLYAPRILEALQPNTAEQFLDDTIVDDEEILYSHVASYCYQITGYGGELCLDWTDQVLADYHATVVACFEPYREVAIIDEEGYIAISDCLADSTIPPPL